MKVACFFGRKSRCTPWSIWRATSFLEKRWRYEKLVFRENQCYFRDVQNPGGQLFLAIKGLQVTWTCCCWPLVRMKVSVMGGHRYHYSLFRDKIQKLTRKNSFDLKFVLPRDIVANPVLKIVIFVTVTDIFASQIGLVEP